MEHKHIEVENTDSALIVTLLDKRILDEVQIRNMGGEIHHEIEEAKSAGDGMPRKVIIDFSNVEYMSSAFLGKLMTADNLTARNQATEGPLMLVDTCPIVNEVFKITSLDRRFKLTDTLKDALQEVSGSSTPETDVNNPNAKPHGGPGEAQDLS